MNRARILVLALALLAGGGAAYLIKFDDPPPPPAPVPAPAARLDTEEVLVANGDIGIGQSISQQTLRWQVWPKAAVSGANFVVRQGRPNAAEQLDGSISRTAFAN